MLIEQSVMLRNIINMLASIFFTYIIFDFMSKFERKIYYKSYIYALAYIIFTLSIFFTGVCSNSLANIIVSLIVPVIIGHFLFNSTKIYILYYCVIISAGCCLQLVISIILQIIYHFFNINFASKEFLPILCSIIFGCIAFGLVKLFIIFFEKKAIEKITAVQYLNFLIFPLFSMFYLSSLLIYIQNDISINDAILLIINAIVLVLLNLYITNMFESISKSNIVQNELILYEQQSEIQYKYYNDLENKYNDSRKIIHDMRNHLQAVEKLYKMQENEAARHYTKDMYEMLDGLRHRYYSSNKVLNIIINDKVKSAELYNICVKCEIGDVYLDFIKDIDLTTIIANLLDNAIEAARLVKNNPYISLKINKFNEFIVIILINSIENIPNEIEKGIFKSHKENHEGIGVMNVKKALKKYDGDFRVEYNKQVFKVNIVIPIGEEK